MAIEWPCPLSVDAYVAADREIEVPQPNCPDCSGPMTRWSGYRRFVRDAGGCRAIFVPRARCAPCAKTHALLPAFVVVRRLDVAAVIGRAIEEVTDRRSGVRPVASTLQVPHTTARGWLRRFSARARELAVAFAALCVELGGDAAVATGASSRDALHALRSAFEQASGLPGWLALGCWRFASAVCGRRLLSTNTDSPYLVIGRRRFMPP
ncbi:MAG: DUF6431 domain-containing protein, partial [Trebonia sp.]